MNSPGEYIAGLVITLLAFFVGVAGGSQVGKRAGRDVERKEAIQAGVAEYIVNSKTGETAFTYKKLPEK